MHACDGPEEAAAASSHGPRIRAREATAWARAIEGASQRTIAVELGVSQPAVSKMLRRAEAHMLAQVAEDAWAETVRQQHRLEFLYRESMVGWKRSLDDRTVKWQRRVDAPGGAAEAQNAVEMTVETQSGDPRYLREAIRILAERRTLIRIPTIAAAEIKREGPAAYDYRRLSDEELAQLTVLLEKAAGVGEPSRVCVSCHSPRVVASADTHGVRWVQCRACGTREPDHSTPDRTSDARDSTVLPRPAPARQARRRRCPSTLGALTD